jgi:hypothetical protein
LGLTRNYLNYTKRQTVMNPYLSQEYSRAHRQDLLAESSQRRTYRQVARFGRAARRAQRAEQRARAAELRLRHAIAAAPQPHLLPRG